MLDYLRWKSSASGAYSHMFLIPFFSLHLTFDSLTSFPCFGVHMAKHGCPITSKFSVLIKKKKKILLEMGCVLPKLECSGYSQA